MTIAHHTDAPTETMLCGLMASDMNEPPTAPAMNSARNHALPTRGSSTMPAR